MSTKITKEEILKIAGLAKLTVTAKEAEKLQGEIAGILDFVAQLKDVDVEGVNPTSHVGGVYNVLRGVEVHAAGVDDEARAAPDQRVVESVVVGGEQERVVGGD